MSAPISLSAASLFALEQQDVLRWYLTKIEQAVAKHDLAASQQAFQQLMKHFQSFPPKSGQQNGGETPAPLNHELQELGAALQSGDSGQVQQAFEQVRQQLQPAPEPNQPASQPAENPPPETDPPSTLNVKA